MIVVYEITIITIYVFTFRTVIIITGILFGRLVLNESITILKMMGALLGIIGLLLVMQPWGILEKKEELKSFLLTIGAGIAASAKITVQKKLCPDLDPDILTFYVSGGGIILSLIPMAIMEKPKWPDNDVDVILLCVHIAAIGLATTTGYRSQLMISQISYSLATSCYIIFCLFGQYTILRKINPGNENSEEYVGVALIFLSIFIPYLGHCTSQQGDDKEQITLLSSK